MALPLDRLATLNRFESSTARSRLDAAGSFSSSAIFAAAYIRGTNALPFAVVASTFIG